MSRGKNLQEMEVGTKQSRTAVNANARAGDPMPKLASGAVAGQTGGWEDLGGPTPENYRSDDDSSKLKEPGLKSVSNVVNKGAKAADSMKGLKKSDAVKEEEEYDEEETLEEEEALETFTSEIAEAKKGKKEEEEDDEEDDDEEDGEEEDDEEDESGKKRGRKMNEARKAKKEEDDDDDDDDEEDMDESFSVEEDVNALLAGEELSEEFQTKARVIFESALRSKVNDIKEVLEEKYEERLVEEVSEISKALQERVDAYLEYVADEWMQENNLAIEKGLKEELTESFLTGMKNLFEEHYVSIPEDKYDVLESMVEKLDDMETKLNEQIERNIQLNKRLSESVADRIFDEISEGLATTQKEKLASLSESVEFESETEYREKLETLKESYFPSRVASASATPETLTEGVDVVAESHSDTMNAYLRTLSAVAKS